MLAELPLDVSTTTRSPGLARPGDLAGEYLVEAKIIADAGDERAVGGERDRRKRPTGFLVAADELGREMRRLGGAAAIADDQQFSAALQRREDHLAGAVDRGAEAGQGLQRFDGFGERGFEGHAMHRSSRENGRGEEFVAG